MYLDLDPRSNSLIISYSIFPQTVKNSDIKNAGLFDAGGMISFIQVKT